MWIGKVVYWSRTATNFFQSFHSKNSHLFLENQASYTLLRLLYRSIMDWRGLG